jgi:phosphoribosyl 1,2-cyclic phosphate phosphodiesterase
MEYLFSLEVIYLIASVTYIFGLKMLGHPETARRGNLIAAFGMTLAIAGTIFLYQGEVPPIIYYLIATAIIIGTVIGWGVAKKVDMTKMPELVSLFNGMGGASAALIGLIEFQHYLGDHTAGLDDVRPFSQRFGEIRFFCHDAVAENLKERFAYIFTTENRYAGAPKVALNIIENKKFILSGKEVMPVEVMHGKLKIFGFKIGKMAYITDAKTLEKKEKDKLKDLDVLIVNALRKDPHPTHFNLEEALEFIEELKPQKAYLTHISNRLGFHKVISNELPPNVFLAYDGLIVKT